MKKAGLAYRNIVHLQKNPSTLCRLLLLKPSKRLKARRTRIAPNPKGGLHRTHAQKPASPGQESGNHRSLFRHYGNIENTSYKVQAYGEQQATQLPLSHLFFFSKTHIDLNNIRS